MLTFTFRRFDELTLRELYAILALRAAVFVVEQRIAFQDADGYDFQAEHCLGFDETGTLQAYTRLFAPDAYYEGHTAIGRVATAPALRRTGAGLALMQASVQRLQEKFPDSPIKIGAQSYLLAFYKKFGFVATGHAYEEDGIPHTHMIRPAAAGGSGSGGKATSLP